MIRSVTVKKLIFLFVICGLLTNCTVAKNETLTYPDGKKYVGQVKDGKANGKGTMIYSSGGTYVGQWLDDKAHGQGVYTWPNGKKNKSYVGQFKNNNFNGQGTMTYSNGDKYEGQWQDDKRHGQGTMYDSKGKAYQKGTFQNDNYIGPDTALVKQGTLTFDNDNKIVGEWETKEGDYAVLYGFTSDNKYYIGFVESEIVEHGTYELIKNKLHLASKEFDYGGEKMGKNEKYEVDLTIIDSNTVTLKFPNGHTARLKRAEK